VADKRRHTEVIRATLTLQGRRLVDIGCGGGALARWLRRQGAHVLGLDAQFDAVRAASAGGIHAAVASADALPLADASADLAVVFNSLHHFPDPAAALTEARRVLTPAGALYVAEPLAEGAYFQVMQPLDDETAERARALAALAHAADAGLAVEIVVDYAHDVVVGDLDSEIRSWIDVEPARATRIEVVRDEIARRFAAHAVVIDQGYALEQPMRSWLLRPT
jgi:SAM-dependent methyltransferase